MKKRTENIIKVIKNNIDHCINFLELPQESITDEAALNSQYLLSASPGGWESEIRAGLGLALHEDSLLGV